jgi:transcriptional regulator GlxA family with amidase domain
VLGKTGLLDGRLATTTWWLERQFRQRYPKVNLQIRPLVTEVDRLMCAGASASYLLQVVKVLERFCGPTIASQTAKTMLIDTTYTTQLPHIPLLAEDTHSDSLVKRGQHWLQRNMTKGLRIAHMAQHLGVSDRTLIRRFATALHQTPRTYLQGLRLEVARALLENGDMNVDQIAAQVGYGDVSAFSRLFRRRIGMSPGGYRTRFQRPTEIQQ